MSQSFPILPPGAVAAPGVTQDIRPSRTGLAAPSAREIIDEVTLGPDASQATGERDADAGQSRQLSPPSQRQQRLDTNG